MRRTLTIVLAALGASAAAIGAAIFLLGPAAVGRAFAMALAALGLAAPPPRLDGADIDSEMRFYAVFWIAYGVFLLRAARRPWGPEIPPLMGLVFAGGVGRLLSLAAFGPPHPLFQLLAAIELILPAAVLALRRLKPAADRS